jgi:thiamine-monophosphate kinase
MDPAAMNEFELIERLTAGLSTNRHLVVGPGDDCAVLDLGLADHWLLFKTDAVVEGVHFRRDSPPTMVGRKALARCLSDVAAMAGTPVSVLVTVGLPIGFDPEYVMALYAGLDGLARSYEVSVAGGETTVNPERVIVSVALLGTVAKERCLLRSGARPGDALFVTGELGGSIAGRHLEFEPRLREARWLADTFGPHAMIDLSDGLAGDLRQILRRSGVGAELNAPSIPITRAARSAARLNTAAKLPLVAALTDGEDYELLFSVNSNDAVPLLDGWKARFPDLRLSCIGKVTAEPGLRLRDPNGIRELGEHAYTHFEQC